MSESELSAWIDGTVSPVRVGVYETLDSALPAERDWNRHYNFWDGTNWYYGFSDFKYYDGCSEHKTIWPRNAKSLKCWRGLASDPSKKASKA